MEIQLFGLNGGGYYTQISNSAIFVSDNNDSSTIFPDVIYTPSLVQTSQKEKKKNFEKFNNALDILKNIDIYKYNLKNESDDTKKHIGFVIGDDFNYSKEVTSKNNDGADIYSFVSLCCQAIKEENEEKDKQIEQLQKEIEKLRKEIKND